MEKDKKYTINKFLSHTLEIIYLLTGEEYVIVKKSSHQSTIEMPNGEVPIKCDDVAVYFSLEEWEYIEGHKELYKEVMSPKALKKLALQVKRSPEQQDEKSDFKSIYHQKEHNKNEKNYQEDGDTNEHCCQEQHDSNEQEMKQSENYSDSHNAGLQGENPEITSVKQEVLDAKDHNNILQVEINQDSFTEITGIQDANPDYISISDQEEDTKKDLQLIEAYTDPYADTQDENPDLMIFNDDGGEIKSENDIQQVKVDQDAYTDNQMRKDIFEESHFTISSSDDMIEDDTRLSQDVSEQNRFKASTSFEMGNFSSAYMSYQSEDMFLEDATEAGYRNMQVKALYTMPFSREVTYGNPQMQTDNNVNSCLECGMDCMKKHMEEKAFKCNECGKDFTYRSSLIKHYKTHTGEKDYKCNECGKPFAVKYNLIQHQRTHTGEKPHKCNICGKRFAYKSAFNQHRRTHTKEKPHLCPECGKCFTRKTNLVKHQKLHTRNQQHMFN
ncbi:zinc finger protein 813 [Bombina bombina]|uniref:zinc finger protein 813 n=1 Tax=Bombina bombina TaxID=8345 RepID=UPI00235B2FB1|nr:zinc finger protein 813 [Bombina bombina]